jgi:hypothetical protein
MNQPSFCQLFFPFKSVLIECQRVTLMGASSEYQRLLSFLFSQINHSGDVKDFYALRMVKNKER